MNNNYPNVLLLEFNRVNASTTPNTTNTINKINESIRIMETDINRLMKNVMLIHDDECQDFVLYIVLCMRNTISKLRQYITQLAEDNNNRHHVKLEWKELLTDLNEAFVPKRGSISCPLKQNDVVRYVTTTLSS